MTCLSSGNPRTKIEFQISSPVHIFPGHIIISGISECSGRWLLNILRRHLIFLSKSIVRFCCLGAI